MLIETSRKGHITALKFQRLYVTGIYGDTDLDLEQIAGLYKGERLELAEANVEDDGHFLAAFSVEPFVSISFAKSRDMTASVVAYSLDRGESERLIGLAERSIRTREPPEWFVTNLECMLIVAHSRMYRGCQQLARAAGYPFESVLGTAYYAHFLEAYKGVEQKRALMHAADKFRLL